MERDMERRGRIQHYSSSQDILLVGEGDFSFSACLAKAFGTATQMVATSLLSKDTVLERHSESCVHLRELKERGCQVLHGVDVHTMNTHPSLINKKFDIIIFNFPHAGHFYYLRETDPVMIRHNKKLISGYFRSAKEMVKEGGEVHVTHRDDHPYCKWELEELAEIEGLKLKEKIEFCKWNYPGYQNRRGSESKGDGDFPLKQCYTFKFTLMRRMEISSVIVVPNSE